MKPTNNKKGCDPVSSSCVVWHGPDITCINLCKGDTVTDVVYKLATELCELLADLNVDIYDLSCLNLGECTPKDFKGLIQILIDKICEDNGIPNPPTSNEGCPDCVVATCEAFHYQNPTGDTVRSMQLKDYVLAIGNRVCSLIAQGNTNSNIQQQQDARITSLENAPAPVFNLPQITPTCVLPSVATDIDTVLIALEEQFCELRNYTGNTQAIVLALQAACLGINTSNQLSGSGQMQDINGWFINPANLAQSFSNVWKTICDIRNAVSFIQINCCDTSCNAIDLNVKVTVNSTTEIKLDFSGSIPNNYIDSVIGSTIVITDDGGGGPQTINTVAIKGLYFDTAQPYIIPLVGVNGANDIIVKVTYRFLDPVTQSTCENLLETIGLGTETCPTLTIVPGFTNVDFSFAWNGPTPTYITAELLSLSNVVLASQVINVTGINNNALFSALTENTSYKIRLVIQGVPCNSITFTTLDYVCAAPLLVAPSITYTSISGIQNGGTIEDYVTAYNAAHP
jgi:hypothetical protein